VCRDAWRSQVSGPSLHVCTHQVKPSMPRPQVACKRRFLTSAAAPYKIPLSYTFVFSLPAIIESRDLGECWVVQRSVLVHLVTPSCRSLASWSLDASCGRLGVAWDAPIDRFHSSAWLLDRKNVRTFVCRGRSPTGASLPCMRASVHAFLAMTGVRVLLNDITGGPLPALVKCHSSDGLDCVVDQQLSLGQPPLTT
jgi:hypothetical protein